MESDIKQLAKKEYSLICVSYMFLLFFYNKKISNILFQFILFRLLSKLKVKLLIQFLKFHDSYLFSSYNLKVVFLVSIIYNLILFQFLQFKSKIFSLYNLYFNYILVFTTKKYVKIISYKLVINYELFFYYKLFCDEIVTNYLLIYFVVSCNG